MKNTTQLSLTTSWRNRSALALGIAVWTVALAAIWQATSTLAARESQNTKPLLLTNEQPGHLHPGDMVYLATEGGLVRVGEVAHANAHDAVVSLTIEPSAFTLLNESTQVTCWQAPLRAEDALAALLPPMVLQQASQRFLDGWQAHRDTLGQALGPLVANLLSDFLDTIGNDISASFDKHQDELSMVAERHGAALAQSWPIIQQRLRPILQEHLTPVIASLINEAISDAPKMKIAWNMARGHYAQAYQTMLDWLSDYLADLSEAEKTKLGNALRTTWSLASKDPVVIEQFSTLGHNVLEDPQLQKILTDIYREAITENPHASAFFHRSIIESPEIREQFFQFVDVFGPIARQVAATCLFDERGATRPEIAYLVRSIALGRPVTWITLQTPNPDAADIAPGATLIPVWKGSLPH